MVKWKDFLYFSKGDKIAIIILCTLICFCGAFFIFQIKYASIESSSIRSMEESRKQFIQFEDEMIQELPIIEDSSNSEYEVTHVKKKKQTKATKLELGKIIDINSASLETLTLIPGIGETFAKRIIDYRTSLGGFISLEQLMEIKGISLNKYSKILPFIIIKNQHKLISFNKGSREQLSSHPYLSEKQISKVISLRNNIEISSIDQLIEDELFSLNDIERLTPYLSFE